MNNITDLKYDRAFDLCLEAMLERTPPKLELAASSVLEYAKALKRSEYPVDKSHCIYSLANTVNEIYNSIYYSRYSKVSLNENEELFQKRIASELSQIDEKFSPSIRTSNTRRTWPIVHQPTRVHRATLHQNQTTSRNAELVCYLALIIPITLIFLDIVGKIHEGKF